MNSELPKDIFETRTVEILDTVTTVQIQALREVAHHIATTNTTIRDVDLEIDEKISYGHNLDDLAEYLDQLKPGSLARINALMNQTVSEYYNSLEVQ